MSELDTQCLDVNPKVSIHFKASYPTVSLPPREEFPKKRGGLVGADNEDIQKQPQQGAIDIISFEIRKFNTISEK